MPESAVATYPALTSDRTQFPTHAQTALSEPSIGICPSELIDDFVHERVRFTVSDLGDHYRLSRADRDDLAQDIYLALCESARRYDCRQASRHTFACRVIMLAAAHRARSIRNARRCPVRSPISLSSIQCSARAAVPRAPRWSEPSARDLALDLRSGLSRLSRRQQFLAEALKTLRVSEIAAEKGQHRSTVHRDLAAMRHTLSASGLDPSL